MNFREQVTARFSAAKQNANPSLEEAKAINAERLREKQFVLTARIGKLIETLNETDVDDWSKQLDEAEQKRFSARLTGIHAGLKSTFLTNQKA